jgi:hypothetical protein
LSDRCKTNSVQGLQQPYAHCTAQRDWCLTFDHLPIVTWDTVLFFKAILRRGLRSGGERWRRSRGVIVVELWQNLCRCGVLLPSQSNVKPPQVHSGTPFINNRFYPRTSSQVSLAPTLRETESLDTTLSRLCVGGSDNLWDVLQAWNPWSMSLVSVLADWT